jgi:hypothetical protein
MKFSKGDKVIIKHQRDIGVCTVTNPYKPTDLVRVGSGEPVGFYVVIDTHKGGKNLGYHQENLELVQ